MDAKSYFTKSSSGLGATNSTTLRHGTLVQANAGASQGPAHQYMRLRKWEGLGWRFDVLLVCLTQSDGGWAHRIRWPPEAFFPEPT